MSAFCRSRGDGIGEEHPRAAAALVLRLFPGRDAETACFETVAVEATATEPVG